MISGVRALVDQARRVIERKKRVKIGELAYILGKSYTYTKYGIARVLLEMNDCVKSNNDELVWICDDSEDNATEQVREQARREAREHLEKLEQARQG